MKKKREFNRDRREAKREQAAAVREAEREKNTPNGQRRLLYSIISDPSKLIEGDKPAYCVVRGYIINRNPSYERSLPSEPLQSHYSLARKILTQL